MTFMVMKSLQFDQLTRKIQALSALRNSITPSGGWVNAIRTAFGISLQQLGDKLSITKQSALDIEKREREGTITIKALREAARALDMQLVYGFVPMDGSLDALIERKAKELATQIVLRASHTMKLEDQENTEQRIKKAIEERTALLKSQMPKSLWD